MKLATAPTSSRPARSREISAPMSKSSGWTRTTKSASGDRRKEGHLGTIAQGCRGIGQHLVDRDLDIAPLPQRFAPVGIPPFQPGTQFARAGDTARQTDLLAADAERLAQGGEIDDRDVHTDTSVK